MATCNSIPFASSPITFDVQYFMSTTCFQCETNGCSTTLDSKCVFYTGPNLSCSGIETGDTVEESLQKIDAQICSAIGDYSNYQMNCLPAWYGQAITQESTFVNAITAYVCETQESLSAFVDTTFEAYKSTVSDMIEAVSDPTVTCASVGVTSLDSLETILTKYCTKFGQIDSALSISTVNWSQCLTVLSSPTTIAGAFSLVVDQICQVKALTGAALPTFNNLGTCLASPGSADSLVATIGKMITRLCLSPTYDGDNIQWGCAEEPADNLSLEKALDSICASISTVTQTKPTFDGSDFIVTPTDPMDACAGVTVALAVPLNQDRFVAATASDSSPSTLQGKCTAGTNITLDFLSTPGQMIISAASAVLDYKVKASSGDTTPDFLDQKLAGSSNSGVTLSPIYNAINEQVDLTVNVNTSTLLDLLLDELVVGSDLYNKFCAKVALCPCNCGTTDCTSYEVTETGGAGGPMLTSYTDCVSGVQILVDVAQDSTITVCARTGSVNTVASHTSTIVAIASCSGGTTSSTTSTTTTPP